MDLVSAKALTTYWQETVSNRIPYLGEGLFPAKKKMGLDLAWIKGYKGLPIALKPSHFDTKATVRDRIGVKKIETEMPFFREAMTIKERDRQELLRFRENDNQNLYSSIINEIFDDRAQLIEGALIQSERMRMQLLVTGGISIVANNVDYTYNYDVDGDWQNNNYEELSGTSLWTDTTNSTPLEDIREMQQKIVDLTGVKPTRAIMTQKTFNYLLQNKSIKIAINPLANGANLVREAELKSLLLSELGLSVAVYDKKFKDETGATKNFYPDGYITLLPASTLGNTYYGTTPEEADLQSANFNGDVSIVETGVAVTTINIPHPVNKETIVSEIVLPSFERMNEVATIKVAAA
jgi:hypothetical protein